MSNRETISMACKSAFPSTLPILAGFTFLGIAYGIFMNALGFEPIYAILMSLIIFAGSMEFVAANLLMVAFNPLNALFLTLMLNARHVFYGLSMLETYKGTGKKKIYLIFGLCDESFAINSSANIPSHVDRGWFMFFVTLLNHSYWVIGATIGSLFGSMLTINTEGLEFVMTALFLVIFLDQWTKEKKPFSSLTGLCVSFVALLLFGAERFIIPAMILILFVLTIKRKPQEKSTEW
ncbi:azaleucine resistance protein AzlC [Aureibacillus halotolerans]|uniref:4-azaleucine resistance transporter AzlC n=1 Tax=Aureibacillus halotolerans TaxID=1508390 RepID=A0A4R6U2R9_9BACI|nr:azaleucine resistance protein AzlC [Aureibacillus halotolerans]TDQ40728.1 4-azaleucine resistance transporter AzlC [Aureibacillus halotolerans]